MKVGSKVIANKNFKAGRFEIRAGQNGVIADIGQFTGCPIVRWDVDKKSVCKWTDLTLKYEN